MQKIKLSELRLLIREAIQQSIQTEAKTEYEYIYRPSAKNSNHVDAVVKYGKKEKVIGTYINDEKAKIALDKWKKERGAKSIDKEITSSNPKKPFDESVNSDENRLRKFIRNEIRKIK